MNLIYAYAKPNGKIVYIGQTVDLYTRNKQHIDYDPFNPNNKEYEYPLSRGVRKYGKDYYSLVILEENIPLNELDNRERYWIKFYDTYWHGYNQTTGGTWPTAPSYPEDIIDIVFEMLKDENFSYNDIKEKTGISITHIYNLNNGTRRHRDDIEYPIRKPNAKGTKNLKFNEEEIKKITDALLNTNKKYSELAKEFGCSSSTIEDINHGRTKKYRVEGQEYPIRKKPHSVGAVRMWEKRKACIDYPDKGSKTSISTEFETVAV